MAQGVRIVDGLTAEHLTDAANLIFEYMAMTLGEGGRPVPLAVSQLPGVLRRECEDLAACYASPGALFVAYQDDRPVGCVGLAPGPPPGAVEVRRLFVRPAGRSRGLGRLLMGQALDHAASGGFQRSVLDVMPSRRQVIEFYRRLGYQECEPFAAESPDPMIFLERPTTTSRN
jgi:ribosomal protein S18 acetylase RimI-like enzyme